MVLMTRQGVRREIDGTAFAVLYDESTLKGGIVVFRDITELRLLESRLRSSAWLEGLAVRTAGFSGQLIAFVREAQLRIHEFRESSKDSLSPSSLNAAESALASAAGILRELHEYPVAAAVPALVDLNVLVRDTTHLVEGGLPGSVTLRLELPDEPTPVRAGREQICHALLNLILHAARTAGENPEIFVTCGLLDSSPDLLAGAFPSIDHPKLAFLEVAERSSGLKPPGVRPRFDPLFASEGRSPGLDLGVVFAIARAQSGAIHLQDSGGGLSTRLLLPALPHYA